MTAAQEPDANRVKSNAIHFYAQPLSAKHKE
jgi:hypothetical protein